MSGCREIRKGNPAFGRRRYCLAMAVLLVTAAGWALSPASTAARESGSQVVEFALELTAEEAQELADRGWQASGLGPGWGMTATEGSPLLPARSFYLSLPPGTRVVDVEVVSASAEHVRLTEPPVSGFSSAEGEAGGSPRKETHSGVVPPRIVEFAGEGSLAGERLAALLFHPLRYRPDTEDLLLHRRVTVRLVLEPTLAGEGGVTSGRGGEELGRTRQRSRLALALPSVSALNERRLRAGPAGPAAEGDGEFLLFRPGDYPVLDGSVVEYLIVTTDEMAGEFERLAEWRTRSGHPAVVRTVSWIEANYPGGADLADKIRLMIRDAYENWGTQWVLLGADTEDIPTRLAHIVYYYYPNGEDLACDLFYGSLDGSWDGDGDGIFGEGYEVGGGVGDSVDLYPEVFLGRAPVTSAAEAQIFVDKTLGYENPDSLGYQARALFAGEVLFPYTWNGDPDSIALNGCDIAHQAGAYVPGDWDTTYLCQYPDDDLGPDTLLAALGEGYGLVNVVDHGDAFKIRVTNPLFLGIQELGNLGNDGEFFIVNYSNCNTSQFDLKCLNEYLILDPGGGAVGAVAPSRLAFPNVARHYQGEFYRVIFETEATTLGEVYALSRLPFVAFAGQDGPWRWTHLSYVLLGDPALPLWKTVPDTQVVAHEDSMLLGDSTYAVAVTAEGSPVEGALVVLWKKDTGEYARGRTDLTGLVTLPFRPGSLGTVSLDVTHPSYLPVSDSMSVVGGEELVHVSGVLIDDDDLGLSSGNGDGSPDAGERLELGVTLVNGSGTGVTGVTGDLSLLAGAEFTAALNTDGEAIPGLVFLGRGRTHPDSLPLTVGLEGSLTEGRPAYAAAAPDDSTSDPADTTGVPVYGRQYLWEDGSGWHLRAAGGLTVHAFSGTLSTGGALRGAEPSDLEGADTFSADSQNVFFSFSVDSTDAEDGLDLVWADSLYLVILDGTESYGDIAAGDSATRTFLIDIPAAAPSGQVGRFDLVTTTNEGTWSDGLRLEVTRAELANHFHEVDDSTHVGNGDGIPQVGETVELLCHVLNEGTGSAEGVQGTLRALSGAAVSDSLDTFGAAPPGSLVKGQDGMVLTVVDLAPVLELELRDSYGRTWVEQFELEGPEGVTGLARVPPPLVDEGGIDLGWDPAGEADLLGYLIYRSSVPEGSPVLLSSRVVQGSAYFRDGGAPAGSTYYYRVAAVDSAGTRGPVSAAVPAAASPPYQGSYPASTLDVIWSSPLMVDLVEDGTGDWELACGSKDGRAYLWDETGAPFSGWPCSTGSEIWSSPCAVDLDGDGVRELCFGSSDHNVYAWHHDGTGLLSPDGLFAYAGGQVRSSPAAGDIDLDGDLELLAGSYDGNIYAWQGDGTGYLNPDGLFGLVGHGVIASSPTLANVDADAYPEVFISAYGVTNITGRVYAFNHDGTGLVLWDGEFALVPGNLWSSVAVGDVDNDNEQEVVVGCTNGAVYMWNGEAIAEPGWPKWTGGEVWSSPALGDLDGDEDLEIVVGSADYFVYAWHHDGTPVDGWPDSTGFEIYGSPILVDLDDDLLPEVMVGSLDGLLYAWDGDGSLLAGWPVRTGDGIYGSPAAGDLDRDGDLEVAVGSYDGRVHVWDLATPANDAANHWPMFAHDAFRSGWYDRPQAGTGLPEPPLSGGGIPAVTGLGLNVPNPFNPVTVIDYQLRRATEVELAIYDVTGRRVRVLARGPMPAGYHQIVWDGCDEEGRTVASGLYLYRLEADERAFARKMVLMR